MKKAQNHRAGSGCQNWAGQVIGYKKVSTCSALAGLTLKQMPVINSITHLLATEKKNYIFLLALMFDYKLPKILLYSKIVINSNQMYYLTSVALIKHLS